MSERSGSCCRAKLVAVVEPRFALCCEAGYAELTDLSRTIAELWLTGSSALFLDRSRAKPLSLRLKRNMALPLEANVSPQDPRAVRILAKSIYRELRASGLVERDVMSLASELLSLVTSDMRGQYASEAPERP